MIVYSNEVVLNLYPNIWNNKNEFYQSFGFNLQKWVYNEIVRDEIVKEIE